jgi:hypothetical protein
MCMCLTKYTIFYIQVKGVEKYRVEACFQFPLNAKSAFFRYSSKPLPTVRYLPDVLMSF